MNKTHQMPMFDNTVKVEWLDDSPRKMRLLEPLCFIDANGKPWLANKGDVIDGASIPKFFWRFIGSPFVGNYRRPSVVHDVYCVSRKMPYKTVHKMFYEAMLTEGVPKIKAKAMYYGVRLGGPRW